ncbi:chaperonin 10-like protein [Lasiosphaeria hispida]|uniref:Chaperonin 10-like protein n=1 Tax=Lasiosphaeria hispida TaxID=260671 RepID=A0AAJ0MGQ3_9PEZI|nr:chaperonin 10-like protein [Lasiosphaeria hispida]
MAPVASTSTSIMRQYVATKKGGPFQVVTGTYPTPGPDEICVRNRAVGLNALDLKNLYHGQTVKAWPEIFGIDAAGVVEVVGDKVTQFKAGDAVMCSAGLGGRRGGFQEVTTVPEHFAALKPAAWSFAQASSAPICYLAACAAITKGLGISLPHLAPLDTPKEDHVDYYGEKNPQVSNINNGDAEPGDTSAATKPPVAVRSVLVLGGSSGVGTSALQLLRIALGPDAVILCTNSPAHNKRLVGLGATACVDRNLGAKKLVAAVKAATPSGKGVDAVLDAVAGVGGDDSSGLWEVLRADGPKLYSNVFTGEEINVPDGVRGKPVFAHMMLSVIKGGKAAMGKLGELVEEGKYQLPLDIKVVGRSLEDIGKGLDRLQAGVSGTKLVVSL